MKTLMKRILASLCPLVAVAVLFDHSFGQFTQTHTWNLSWKDNSDNEQGFRVEIGTSAQGPWNLLTEIVGANIQQFSYAVPRVDAQTNCARVAAFNADGEGVSEAVCSKQPATLTVMKAGTGQGTVASAPTGIDCGTICSALFPADSVVTLTPTPVAGSMFTGWMGACTGTGACIVNMNAAKTVTASFAPIPVPPTAPTELKLSAAPTPNEVKIGWLNNSPDLIDGQKVHVRGTRGPGSDRQEYIEVGRLASSYADLGVTRNTSYQYQIESYKHGLGGWFSNVLEVKTPNR